MGFQIGHKLEAIGDSVDTDGYAGSWFAVKVIKVLNNGNEYLVEYDDLTEEDGTTKVRGKLSPGHLRPRAPDDSKEIRPQDRNPGDAVEVYWHDGWWEGYVVDRESDRISVYFPDSNEYWYDIGQNDKEERWVRTSYEYDSTTQQLVRKKARKLPVDRTASKKKERKHNNKNTKTGSGVGATSDNPKSTPKSADKPADDSSSTDEDEDEPLGTRLQRKQEQALSPVSQQVAASGKTPKNNRIASQGTTNKSLAARSSGTDDDEDEPLGARLQRKQEQALSPAAQGFGFSGSKVSATPGSKHQAAVAPVTAATGSGKKRARTASPAPSGTDGGASSYYFDNQKKLKAVNKVVEALLGDLDVSEDSPGAEMPALSPLSLSNKTRADADGADVRAKGGDSGAIVPPRAGQKTVVGKHPAPVARQASLPRPPTAAGAAPAAAHSVVAPDINKLDTTYKIPKRIVTSGASAAAGRQLNRVPSSGSYRGNLVWCLDNVSSWVTSEALFNALRPLVGSGLVRAEVASVQLDCGVSHAGYAVLQFRSHVDAEKGAMVLQTLCICSPDSPLPRPLLLRRPRVTKGSSSCPDRDLPGHLPLKDATATPHFAQSNHLEFEFALEWRVVLDQGRIARNQLHLNQARSLAELMQKHLPQDVQKDGIASAAAKSKKRASPSKRSKSIKNVKKGSNVESINATLLGDLERPLSGTTGSAASSIESRCLWLSGVSPRFNEEKINQALSQFGVIEEVITVRDKVTGDHAGHAVVRFDSAARAALVAKNLQDMIFVAGGTPRPLCAEVARAGAPRGSQSVFDRALRAVTGRWDSGDGQLSNTAAATVAASSGKAARPALELVSIPDSVLGDDAAPVEHRLTALVRVEMQNFMTQNDEMANEVQQRRAKLHAEVISMYETETGKMNRLNTLLDSEVFRALQKRQGIACKRFKTGAAPLLPHK